MCCLIIWRASNGFEAASEFLGRNLSEGVRGATINAIGSSIPELFTTLFFLFVLSNKDGFAGGIGTTAGSAIFNGMIIPSVVILVVVFKGLTNKVEVSRKALLRDGIALILCELVLIFLIGGESLNWTHGLVLMGLYAIYMMYMLTSMKPKPSDNDEEGPEEEEEDRQPGNFVVNVLMLNLRQVFIRSKINSSNAWTLLTVSTLVIGAACLLLVKSCEWLGDSLNIPIYFIAVILASAATSVPDTILSMKDAKKGNYDDAVSNALGSNIFDVCFALGLPLFLYTVFNGPIQLSAETVANISELRILLLGLTFVAFLIYIARRKMGWISAILLLSIYLVFTLYILDQSGTGEITQPISDFLANINAYISKIRF